MKNILTIMQNIKWYHTILAGILFAVAYIVVDDNNIVTDGIQNTFYYIAWAGIFATMFLILKRKTY